MMKDKKDTRLLIYISFAVAFTFFLFAPFEIYIFNSEELWFKINLFWWIPILSCLVFTLLFFGLGILLGRLSQSVFRVFLSLLFASGICIWIQGNFLNAYTGVLNGSDFNWYDIRSQAIRDIVVWLLIAVISVLLIVKLTDLFKTIMKYVSLLLVGMQAVTLIYLLIHLGISGVGYGSKESSFLTYEGLYNIGSNKNVVVLLADMYDDDYFKDIMENYPELTEELDGFTYFNNYTGLYPATALSINSMFTGKVFLNEMNRPEWMEKQAQSRLYLDELTDVGYTLDLYTTEVNSVPTRIMESAENYVTDELRITDYGTFTVQLYRLVGCKYLPNALKKFIWMNGDEFNNLGNKYFDSNKAFRDGLREAGISVKGSEKQFKFIHIDGMHFPFEVDEEGNDIPYTNLEPPKHAKGVWKILMEYIRGLKESGQYDNTAIIITADHGVYANGTLTNPVYLVKPMNSRGELKINNAPCSQKNISSTILQIAEVDNYTDYGISDFDIDENDEVERFFYQYYLSEGNTDINKVNMRLIEFSIPSTSNDVESFQLTNREYTVDGDVIEHDKYCLTCREHRDWDRSDRYYKPTLVHEASKDNPSYKYINTDFYSLLKY